MRDVRFEALGHGLYRVTVTMQPPGRLSRLFGRPATVTRFYGAHGLWWGSWSGRSVSFGMSAWLDRQLDRWCEERSARKEG